MKYMLISDMIASVLFAFGAGLVGTLCARFLEKKREVDMRIESEFKELKLILLDEARKEKENGND